MTAPAIGRAAVVGLLVGVAVATACGIAYEGPPPRYADAPPEPSAEPPAVVVAAGPADAGPAAVAPTSVADAGAGADGGPVATGEDGGAAAPNAGADAGPPGIVLATGPLTREQWDQLLAIGRGKVNRVCSECHGIGIAPNLIGRRVTAERVRQMVRQGGGEMRRLSQRRVSDQELEGVIVFLSTVNGVRDLSPPQ